MLADRLLVAPDVAAALAERRPVVALESTLISHGLPYPANLEVARASEAAVRAAGATPATVAIHAGRLLVGLDETALEALATAPAGSVRKAARPSLAAAIADGGWAATTVSATMIAAHAAGIAVFATGGIGGVHRGALGVAGSAWGSAATFDISSDLEELGRTPMAVVCAGPKAILDVPATLEYLETRGVPVVAIGQTDLPGFYARSAGIAAPGSVPDVAAAAGLVAAHLGLGLTGSILLCVPVPALEALDPDAARDAIGRAIRDAEAAGIAGPALTPWLLGQVAQLTGGASLRANTALIVNDARVAGEIAVQLASGSPPAAH
jgi:pseudouridine-5'-phosphate glycosidase